MAELDRFDRMLLASPPPAPSAPLRVVATMPEPGMVITSKRGPRYIDHTTCPMCGVDGQGIEYHGELMSGAKVHKLAAHTAGMRRTQNGEPRCLGAGMRVVFEGGVWKGLR